MIVAQPNGQAILDLGSEPATALFTIHDWGILATTPEQKSVWLFRLYDDRVRTKGGQQDRV